MHICPVLRSKHIVSKNPLYYISIERIMETELRNDEDKGRMGAMAKEDNIRGGESKEGRMD